MTLLPEASVYFDIGSSPSMLPVYIVSAETTKAFLVGAEVLADGVE